MTAFLVHTNVVSELTRFSPDRGVIDFLTSQTDLWFSSLVLHELEYGLHLLPPGRRHHRISSVLSAFLDEYSDRVLGVGPREAEEAALLRVKARRSGHVLRLADALIAGTAVANSLSLATRNVSDFADLNVSVVNPWEALWR